MSIAWIAPAALIGIALIALPIAIHLLVRQHARTLAYPSLRFLRETQLAAFRRRTIQDAGLLTCRALIIAMAAMALAGPLVQTSSRTARYAARVSRAIVTTGAIDEGLVTGLKTNAFASADFRRAAIADALTDAMRWLDQQPPSTREVVIVGAFPRGSITDGDLASIPEDVGVRFQMVPTPAVSDVTWPILKRRDGMLVRVDRAVHFGADATHVTDGMATPVPADLISIKARAEDQPLADAALRAALDAGVPWRDFDHKVVITWDAAPVPTSSAADVVLAELTKADLRPEQFEPVAIPAEQLNKWSRPPGPPAINAPLAEEGDRRWVWIAVLILIGLETWLRRGRDQAATGRVTAEARVA